MGGRGLTMRMCIHVVGDFFMKKAAHWTRAQFQRRIPAHAYDQA